MSGMNHVVYNPPVGQSSEVSIIYPQVRHQFTGGMMLRLLLGIVGVNGIEFQAFGFAVIYGFLQQGSFANRPQDNLMMVFVL